MKHITFQATCECGWASEPFTTAGAALQAAKQHHNDNPHRDFDEDPLF
mgnify:FL=1